MAFAPEKDIQLDEKDTQAMFKASYLFQFSVQSDWPEDDKTGAFKMGVYGNHSLYEELVAKYATKPIGGQVLEVLEILDLEDLEKLHVIYVSKEKSEDLELVREKTSTYSSLIVSHVEKGLERGAIINFVIVESGIRYELSLDNANSKGITIGSKLLQWSTNK